MGLVSKYKRGGTWYLYYARKIGGTRRSLGVSDAKAAEAIRVKEEYDILFRKFGVREKPIARIRFRAFSDAYIAFKTGQGRAPATLCCYRVALNNFGDFLRGDVYIDQITSEQVEAFGAFRRGAERAEKTIRNEVIALSTAFSWGVKRRFLASNPVADTELPRPVKHPPRYLRREEYLSLMSKIDDEDFRDVVMFYLLTGCRRGEGIDVRIGTHIDLDRKTLTIPQRKQRDYKTIPISDSLMPVIKRLILRAKESDELIPYHEDTLTGRFAAYAEKAKLPEEITFHALRHTFGTWLASEGVSFTTIQILMGQRDPESTKHYVHAYNDDLGRAIDKLKLPLN